MILAGMKLEEIEDLMNKLGATKFRAKQIHNWLYAKSVSSIDEMTNLSKDFREQLKQTASVTETKIKIKQVSSDGTIKYLVEYPDGECVETVLMRFDNRANLTACVSSQVGCAVNCSFCAPKSSRIPAIKESPEYLRKAFLFFVKYLKNVLNLLIYLQYYIKKTLISILKLKNTWYNNVKDVRRLYGKSNFK